MQGHGVGCLAKLTVRALSNSFCGCRAMRRYFPNFFKDGKKGCDVELAELHLVVQHVVCKLVSLGRAIFLPFSNTSSAITDILDLSCTLLSRQ